MVYINYNHVNQAEKRIGVMSRHNTKSQTYDINWI